MAQSVGVLPKGVMEITPHLYLGPETAVKDLLLKHNLRHVLRCMDEPFSYNNILEEERVRQAPFRERQEKASSSQKKSVAGSKEDEEDDNDEDDESETGEGEEKEGGTAAPKSAPSTITEVEEVDKENPAGKNSSPLQSAGGVADGTTTCPVCSKPAPKPIDWLNVDVQSYFCHMEDTLEFNITKTVPQALDWLDSKLRALGDRTIPDPRGMFGEMDEEEEEEDEGKGDGEGEGESGADASAPEQTSHPSQVGSAGPTSTTETEQSPTYLAPNTAVDLSRAVYVHCKAGISRSTTVIAAYLITRKEIPLQRCFEEFLPPDARPNPSFLHQLVELEEDALGKPTTFDLNRFNLDGLLSLFPDLDSELVESTFHSCKGNVVQARNLLMKKQLLSVNRNKLIVEALVATVGNGITFDEANAVFEAKNKDRDAALLFLLNQQREKKLAQLNSSGPMDDVAD